MNYLVIAIKKNLSLQKLLQSVYAVILLMFLFQTSFYARSVTISENNETLIVEDAGESEVLAFGKNIIVKKSAKGALALGGDIVIEGKVDGDVATLGGSVIQKEGAYIGGDVIVLGGTYRAEGSQPLRNSGKETVVVGVFEQEFRDFARNPSQIFSPELSWSFFAQRLLSVLFWFIISLVVATVSPAAVSRAIARIQLSTLKVLAVGISGFLISTVGVIVSVGFLPGHLSGIVGLMMLILLTLAYIFGRVALQVSFGKSLQKKILPEKFHSETLAILLGVIVWTIILSIPYLWTFAFVILFSAGIGLVFTARDKNSWRKSEQML